MVKKGNHNNSDSDAVLFLKYIKEKDHQSFRDLYDRVNPWLFDMIYNLVGDKEVTLDILQETWIAAVKYGQNFNPKKGRFSNYLFQIAKNQVFQWRMHNKEYYPIEERDEPVLDSHENDVANKDLGEAIRFAIRQLKNHNFQNAIMLYYFGDLKVMEIAGILDTNQQNVKNWLKRGREILEKELEKVLSEF